jgi:hypothetical protein
MRVIKETQMLSPHELATLILVKNAPDQIELDRVELGILLMLQLVVLKEFGSKQYPHITRYGEYILKAAEQFRKNYLAREGQR